MIRNSSYSLPFVFFLFACVLLFIAFTSRGKASIPEGFFLYPVSGNNGLAARLKQSEALWAENIKGRQEMRDAFEKDPKKNRRYVDTV